MKPLLKRLLISLIILVITIVIYALIGIGYFFIISVICFVESILYVILGDNFLETTCSTILAIVLGAAIYILYGYFVSEYPLEIFRTINLTTVGYSFNILRSMLILGCFIILLTVYINTWQHHPKRHSPIIRIAHAILVLVLALLCAVLPFYIDYCINDIYNVSDQFTYFWLLTGAGIGLWATQLFVRKHFIAFAPKHYILYLRSFDSTKSYEILDNIIDSTKIPILQIADPDLPTTSIEQGQKVQSLFLPTRKWKGQVRYYIAHADVVLCEVGATDGVKWEITGNKDYMGKYIYSTKCKKNLELLKDEFPFFEAFLKANSADLDIPVSICMIDGKGYQSDCMENLLKAKLGILGKDTLRDFNYETPLTHDSHWSTKDNTLLSTIRFIQRTTVKFVKSVIRPFRNWKNLIENYG